MTENLLADFSFARIPPYQIAQAGYKGIIRYLSHDPNKRLTPNEIVECREAGLLIGLVWEDAGQAALGGMAQGKIDAETANAQADSLGIPDNVAIYFAVDFQPEGEQVATVLNYLAAAQQASKRPSGVYGDDQLIESRFDGYRWQTEAWSGNVVSDKADLYQRVNPTLEIPGIPRSQYDENVILHEQWGGWNQAAPAPKPPIPNPPNLLEGEEMYVVTLTDGRRLVSNLMNYRWLETESDYSLALWLTTASGHQEVKPPNPYAEPDQLECWGSLVGPDVQAGQAQHAVS